MKIASLHQYALVGALGLFAGCGEEPPPPAAAAPAARKKAAETAPVVAATQVDYAYNAVGKRDPFRGAFIVEDGPKKSGDEGPKVDCTDPLCLSDIDDFTVVAVVSGDANPLAMVEDRSGTGYLVRRNTRIGKQGGKVTQILRDCVVVTSFISGGADGKPQANKQNMCVKTDSRSTPALDLLKNKEFIP